MEKRPSRGQKFNLELGAKWYLCCVTAEDFGIPMEQKLLGESFTCRLCQLEMIYIEHL